MRPKWTESRDWEFGRDGGGVEADHWVWFGGVKAPARLVRLTSNQRPLMLRLVG